MNFFRIFSGFLGMAFFLSADAHACLLFSQRQAQISGFIAPQTAFQFSFGDRVNLINDDEGPQLVISIGGRKHYKLLDAPVGFVDAGKVGVLPGRRRLEVWILETDRLSRVIYDKDGERKRLRSQFVFEDHKDEIGEGPFSFSVVNSRDMVTGESKVLVSSSDRLSILQIERGSGDVNIQAVVSGSPKDLVALARYSIRDRGPEIFIAQYSREHDHTEIYRIGPRDHKLLRMRVQYPGRIQSLKTGVLSKGLIGENVVTVVKRDGVEVYIEGTSDSLVYPHGRGSSDLPPMFGF